MKKETKRERFDQRFAQIAHEGQLELWKATGVNIEAIQKVGDNVNKKIRKLSDELKGTLKDSPEGQETNEEHERFLKHQQQVMELEKQKLIPAGSVLAKDLDLQISPLFCHCGIALFASHSPPPSQLFIRNDPGVLDIESHFEDPDNQCLAHPIVDVGGLGGGVFSEGHLASICRFTFTPGATGVYCVSPRVQLNGHYLAWAWGGCGEQEYSRACAQVRVQARVTQFFLATRDEWVVNECASYPVDPQTQGGFSFNGSLFQTIFLWAGFPVTIEVTCFTRALVWNRGRAWVDMNSSPNYYFRVPYVLWGRRQCIPIGPIQQPGPLQIEQP